MRWGRPKAIEWVAGRAQMPMLMTDADPPYRPEGLFWMSAGELILGSEMAEPGKLLALACDSLRATMEQPAVGPPHAPTRIRVDCAELAEVLREGFADIEIVSAPTPEIDAMLAQMREHMRAAGESERSYLGHGISVEQMAAFFDACAALFRVTPWQVVPDDRSLISVTIERYDVRDAALSVIGQMGESLGLVLFASLPDFVRYTEALMAIEEGEEADIPGSVSINFDRGTEVPATLRKEIDQHRWEVAGSSAYPSVMVVDDAQSVRPPTRTEVVMAEALARAVTPLLKDSHALDEAWDGGEPVNLSQTVHTNDGPVEVTLCVPYRFAAHDKSSTQELLAALATLAIEDGANELDLVALNDSLVTRFFASKEAKKLSRLGSCQLVMEITEAKLDKTIAQMEASELRYLIFQDFPRSAAIGASEGRAIIEEMRAFYRFMRREGELAQADACLRVLGGNAVKKLEAALSNAESFSVAKGIAMLEGEFEFDGPIPEGMEEFLREFGPIRDGFELANSASKQPKGGAKKPAKAKRNKRKSTRKAKEK